MMGRWLAGRTKRDQRTGPLAAVQTPSNAGVLSCRVLSPADEPVPHARFAVGDASGHTVVEGATDPFGSFVATVPAGEYRLEVLAEGYMSYRVPCTVTENSLASLGDVTLQVEQPMEMPAPGDWEIDLAHSSVTCTAQHIGVARVHGRFNSFAGTARITDDPTQTAMHVVIDAATIDTNMKMRDDHLRSEDFLDVERFPTIEFYSDRFEPQGGNRWAVIGELWLHGVARTVTLDMEYLGLAHGVEGEARAICRATTKLHRGQFAVSWQTVLARGVAAVGPIVQVDIDVQLVPKS